MGDNHERLPPFSGGVKLIWYGPSVVLIECIISEGNPGSHDVAITGITKPTPGL
jgi:hypothetical protein